MTRAIVIAAVVGAFLAPTGHASVTWWWSGRVAHAAVSNRYDAPARCRGVGESFRSQGFRFYHTFRCTVKGRTFWMQPVSSWRFQVFTSRPERGDVAP